MTVDRTPPDPTSLDLTPADLTPADRAHPNGTQPSRTSPRGEPAEPGHPTRPAPAPAPAVGQGAQGTPAHADADTRADLRPDPCLKGAPHCAHLTGTTPTPTPTPREAANRTAPAAPARPATSHTATSHTSTNHTATNHPSASRTPTSHTPPSRTPTLRKASPHAPHPAPWVAMYHSVADPADDPYNITVSPERLDAQLGWLRRRGLRGVSMERLLEACARGRGRGLVGLTFDDGYRDFLDHAVPLLHQHGCTATVFVLPGRLGGDNAWDSLGPRKPLLDADGIRRAAGQGMEVASHGLTHVDLTRADDRTLRREVAGSRAALADLTGRDVRGFCYPYGHADPRVLDAVRAAGYAYACAIAPGPLTGPLALPRIHIGQRDTAWRLRLKQATGGPRGRTLRPDHAPLPAAVTA